MSMSPIDILINYLTALKFEVTGVESITLEPDLFNALKHELTAESHNKGYQPMNPRPIRDQFSYYGMTIVKGELK